MPRKARARTTSRTTAGSSRRCRVPGRRSPPPGTAPASRQRTCSAPSKPPSAGVMTPTRWRRSPERSSAPPTAPRPCCRSGVACCTAGRGSRRASWPPSPARSNGRAARTPPPEFRRASVPHRPIVCSVTAQVPGVSGRWMEARKASGTRVGCPNSSNVSESRSSVKSNKSNKLSQMAVPIGVVAIVVMLVVPMPAALLDLLIAMNITGGVLVVLVSMYVHRPLDFSSFPSLLLIATLFRLALNISATRLVLSDGFAGNVIAAFGHFVIGGSLVVGLVIFAILLVIQFIVITNGAGRVAEVGARFTLDAMPGKQMAIDADLNAGLIDEVTARKRRAEISAEADFYGSMDGATRFVKGDAIAAIIITLINLIGGFAIGVMGHHMSLADALSTYSLMSVGDGLVSQIPALLLSVSTGLIVTRASDADDMGTVVARQLGGQRRAVRIAGGAALLLCVVPGLPKLPFLIVGGGLLYLATRLPDPDAAADEATPSADALAEPDEN